MPRFLTTNKRRPCPVCDRHNGNCRISQDDAKVLCMTFPDGDGHSDYKFSKATSDGLWGIHWPRTDNDFDAAAWSQRKAQKEERDREIERQRLEKCLSPEQRDQEIRAVLSQLTLTDGDRRYLENRGVPTEVIDRCRSVTQWQKLASPVHVNLPGISKYGDRLNNPTDGILVAIPDHLVRLVAMRLHDPKAKEKQNGRKYSWLSSASRGVTPHLPNGENPIGLFWPNGQPTDKPKRIGLSEGPEFKAPNAANRLGYPVIGFSGYQFSQSPELLRQAIDAVNPDAEIVLIPDGGAVANVHIANSHRETLTNLESANQPTTVAWWSQLTKADGDIDEIRLNGDRKIHHITPDQFLSYCPKSKVEKFADWVKKQTQRLKPPGFGAPKIAGNRFDGDRQSAWQDAINRGGAFLDSTLMGSGKSHTVPHVTNPYGGVIWYAYSDHRNPTVEAIARDFVDLFPRNSQGFYQDAAGKIKPADDYHAATITKGHCVRSELFPLLTELGHDPNDGGGSNPICQSCPKAGTCAHIEGWYRHDRRVALRSTHIRCHIDSMPRDGWDYSKDIILIDEPSQLLTPTQKITAGWDDLLLEADKIRPTLSDQLWQELDTYLQQAIKPLFGAKGYGLSHAEIVEKLPTVSSDLATAIAAYHHDLAQLFPKAERETLGENFTRKERQQWTPEERKKIKAGLAALDDQESFKAYVETQTNLEQLPPKALANLLTGNGVIRIQGQTLTQTLDRRQDYAFLNRAAAVGFLDATINGDRLQTLTGIERKIQVIHNTPTNPLGNLTVKQIKVQGIGSKSLSNTALNRLHAILKTFPDMPIIGPKSWANRLDFDGYWWRDSRGTNDYAGIPELLAIGLPNPNLGAIQDDYLALNGNLDGFEEHYSRLVNEEILQLIGRQRANRYPDRQFVLNLVTPENCDLSWLTDYGITLEIKQGFEINPAAGNQNQITRHQIVSAILEGHHTQTAIATAIGKTQQAISKQLAAAISGDNPLQILINHLSKFLPEISTTGPCKAYKRASCITPELLSYLDWFFGLDLPAIAVEAISVIEREGWLGFLKYLEQYPKPIQAKFFGVLYSLIGTNPPPPLLT